MAKAVKLTSSPDFGFRKTFAACSKVLAEHGYRSKHELDIAKHLSATGTEYVYEQGRLPYTVPAVYIPDFGLVRQCICIEAKGMSAFESVERTKMIRIRELYPDLDIRFLFTNPNAHLGRNIKMTCATWCDKHGFPFAKGPAIPTAWLEHTPSAQQKEAFQRIFLNG
jgi:Phage endonuclease I.